VVISEELLILASCLLRPVSRNSVLEEFRVRRFAVIQDGIRSRAFWRWSMLESKWVGSKERKLSCVERWCMGSKRKWEYWEVWHITYTSTLWRVKDQEHSLGDTAGGHVPGRQVSFTFDTEATRWQIWLEPAENRAMDTKPGWEMGDQDDMVNSVESSREVK